MTDENVREKPEFSESAWTLCYPRFPLLRDIIDTMKEHTKAIEENSKAIEENSKAIIELSETLKKHKKPG